MSSFKIQWYLRHVTFSFSIIQTLNNKKFWSWLNDVFIPGVFAGRWYNGEEENQTMYIGNKHSLLVGMARARQLRVKSSKFSPFSVSLIRALLD